MARFGKLMGSTGPGSCGGCNADLSELGTPCRYDFTLKKRFCVNCVTRLEVSEPDAVQAPAADGISNAAQKVVDLSPVMAELAAIKKAVTEDPLEAQTARHNADAEKYDIKPVYVQQGDDNTTKRRLGLVESCYITGAFDAAFTQEDVIPE